MRKIRVATRQRCAMAVVALASILPAADFASAAQPRALGLDVSAWQGNISQTTWNNIRNVENRQFVFIRSSRGGTTGYDHLRGGYPANNNTAFTLSQRYDDLYFVQNINRATAAGMFAGSYHFGRMDVIASTPNTGGIPNNGTDEANHFMQQAGPWMRPGYLLPVFDLEAGIAERTGQQLADFGIDFSDRIHEVMGIRPAVYIGGNYANDLQNESNAATQTELVAAFPTLWSARWPNQANPDAIDVQNAHPKDTYTPIYGAWDNPPNPTHPWHFWQYASTGRLQSFNNGGSNLDFDVAQGGAEYLKDHLVPAFWMHDNSGDWSTLANWNSGQTPVAPPGDPNVVSCGTCPVGTTGQLAPIGTQTLPTPRLPGAAGSGVTSGQHDTVILDRGAANPTITVSSGTHNIRKLYVREALNITGGSLTVNYDNPRYASNDPTNQYDPAAGPISAQFSAPVSLSGSASMSVYRLQVDVANTFTLGGGSLTFNQIELMPHASTPASIAMTSNVNFLPFENGTATIASFGAGNSGFLDLGGAARMFNVTNGTSSIDMAVDVPITNGSLTKAGLGTLALGGANSYAGDTIVLSGQLNVANPFLADAADVYVSASSTLHLGYAGNDVVRGLFLNGTPQSEGIWGAEGSGAQFTSPLLTGSGLLHVTATPPPLPSGPGNVLDDFEVDEGHFNWNYNFSPVSQTFGLTSGPANNSGPSDRVTTEHQGLGAASQVLDLAITVEDPLDATWQLRHNSGIGSAAQPAGNVPIDATGYIGFWLKTDDPGITVQIGIDDPVGNTALERGTLQDVIADNQWHLYQWNLEDDNDWFAFAGGANGDIDNAVVTIDSIWFAGSGNAQIYLDTVSHNPEGLLAAYIPGDYDRNGIVEAADRAVWQAAFGLTVIPGTGADGNGDGMVDIGDWLVWRKAKSAPPSSPTSGPSAATPEPSSAILMVVAACVLALAHRRRP